MDKKCEMCGKMMRNVKGDRRFCGECNMKRKAIQQKMYRAKRNLAKHNLGDGDRTAGQKARKSCNPSVENCINCKVPAKYCNGGYKKSKFVKLAADENDAIKDAKLQNDVTTVDAIHEAL